jgi:2-polyprenyl-3-methyl-5-hydroxy-6-metoxy-1,4-benzoquinol methylase
MIVPDFSQQKQTYPFFTELLEMIVSQNPLQRRAIQTHIDEQTEEYWIFAEKLCHQLDHYFLKSQEQKKKAARAYNNLCLTILKEQVLFKKTGIYRESDPVKVNEEIYSQEEKMRLYIVGLLFSYLFWPNHYQMFLFFKNHLTQIKLKSFLEVGVGHGLFTAEVLMQSPNTYGKLIDISQGSLTIAKEILESYQIPLKRTDFIQGDYFDVDLGEEKFDLLIIGEILEHVSNPEEFLTRSRKLIRDKGKIYMSTCVNCPAPDHIYQFHNLEEIRNLIQKSGLKILDERALPLEKRPPNCWEKEKITINYCAFLEQGS